MSTDDHNEVHNELYKIYRPVTWEEVVGQDNVVKWLQSSVVKHSVPSTIGLFGPRGTGKTTTATILAKAVNCENPPGDGNPCNECETCLAIDANQQPGVEIKSMANEGGADNVREMIQRATNKQLINRNVFILDEFHNLSKAAQDSLLIPFEKKNLKPIFIICSTEVNKISPTIMSRIQSANFNLVSERDMGQYLVSVAKREDLWGDDVTLSTVKEAIRQGRGSVRDSMTALENIINLGYVDTDFGTKLLTAITQHKAPEAIAVIEEASQDGVDCRDLAEQLAEDIRTLMLTASRVDSSIAGTVPVEDTKAALRGFVNMNGLITSFETVGAALTNMSYGQTAKMTLEVAVTQTVIYLKKLSARVQQKSQS